MPGIWGAVARAAPDTHFRLDDWRHPARPGGTTDVSRGIPTSLYELRRTRSSHGDFPTTSLVASRRFNRNARADGNAGIPDLDAPHIIRR